MLNRRRSRNRCGQAAEDGEALLNHLTALRPHRCRAEPRRMVDDVLGLEALRHEQAREALAVNRALDVFDD
jgi:hypothetical protein